MSERYPAGAWREHDSKQVDDALNAIKKMLIPMTPEQRLTVFMHAADDYCEACGEEDPTGRCQCWNDE